MASESGAGRDYATVAMSKPFFQRFADNLGCNLNDNACFMGKSARDMNSSMPITPGASASSIYRIDGWGPLVDGVTIPKQPSEMGVQVPAILGSSKSSKLFRGIHCLWCHLYSLKQS
jgi:hypothetical protein